MIHIISPKDNSGNNYDLNIIFLGTPEFALPALEKLAQSEYKPAAVFCAPDAPVGRRQILTPPPVKLLAQKYNIPIFQPTNKKDLAQQISEQKPDLIISAAYGIILSAEVLSTPKFGCLNIHPSLLPKYRGPSPIQTTILNGEKQTGVTIFKMDAGVDTGPIVASREWPMINSNETTPELSKKLAELGADLLIKTLPDWLAGNISAQPQNETLASVTQIITKEDGQIDWKKSAKEIDRQIRAFIPWPGTFTNLKNEKEKIKIIEADILEKNYGQQPGEIFLTDKNELAVQTFSQSLIIKRLQVAGGKPMFVQDFLRGHDDIIGKIFA